MTTQPVTQPRLPTHSLTLYEPWATLMARGAKMIETRSWHPRGLRRRQIAIHASKTFKPEQRRLCMLNPFFHALGPDLDRVLQGQTLGRILAISTMLGWDSTDHLASKLSDRELAFGDYTPGRYGWVFLDTIRLPHPISCRGARMLWHLQAETLDELRRQFNLLPNR
jgi:hypothetical protein